MLSDGYFLLVADPKAKVRQLYSHIILAQIFGTAPVFRYKLCFICCMLKKVFLRRKDRLATLPAPQTLLGITRDQLVWQMERDRTLDGHYFKGNLDNLTPIWRSCRGMRSTFCAR